MDGLFVAPRRRGLFRRVLAHCIRHVLRMAGLRRLPRHRHPDVGRTNHVDGLEPLTIRFDFERNLRQRRVTAKPTVVDGREVRRRHDLGGRRNRHNRDAVRSVRRIGEKVGARDGQRALDSGRPFGQLEKSVNVINDAGRSLCNDLSGSGELRLRRDMKHLVGHDKVAGASPFASKHNRARRL